MKNIDSDQNDEIELLLSLSVGAASRKKILESLIFGPKNCSQVAKAVNLQWWTVYRHLQILVSKDLICDLSMGRVKYYKINPRLEEILKKFSVSLEHSSPG
jgi:predicted transcriptional regulator